MQREGGNKALIFSLPACLAIGRQVCFFLFHQGKRKKINLCSQNQNALTQKMANPVKFIYLCPPLF